MTDKELAKEYVDKLYAEKVSKKDYDKDGWILYRCEDISEAFLNGLKAGRPKWHDLRKNPNDLPKEDCEVFAITETDGSLYKGLEDYYLDKTDTFDGWGTCQKVIAWCEIPQYTED